MERDERGVTPGLPAESGREHLLARVSARAASYFSAHGGWDFFLGVAVFFLGWLFASTPLIWGAYPMGIALLCSQRKRMLSCTLGLCIGSVFLGVRGVIYGVLYILAFLLRLLLSSPGIKWQAIPRAEGLFRELPQLQVTTAVLTAVCAAVYEFAVSGLTTVTLLFAAAMIVGAGVLTGAFSGVFSRSLTIWDIIGRRGLRRRTFSRPERLWLEAGGVAILMCAVWGLRDRSLFGIHFGYLLAAFATLFVSRRFGALRGAVAGMLISLSASAVYAPAFGLMGLLSGVLWPLGAFYSTAIGAAAGIGWCSFVGGMSGFLGVAPELTVATLISLPILPRLYSDAVAGEVRQDRTVAEEAVRDALAREEAPGQVERLSEAFGNLAGAFSTPDFAPDPADCYAMCDEVCTASCRECERRAKCWEGAAPPGATVLSLFAGKVAAGEPVDGTELPTELLTECKHMDTIVAGIRLRGAMLWRDKRRAVGSDYPAPDYALTAELVRDAAAADRRAQKNDRALAGTIRRILADRGLRPAAVCVRGEREKQITVGCAALSGKQREATALLPALEEACRCRLSPPVFDTEGEVAVMETHTVRQYRLEVASAHRPAAGSEVSGDACGVFRTPDGYTYLLLTDGMGTGEAAAHAANTCLVFLDKMLSSGCPAEPTLRMLNRLIAVRERECCVTVDLLQFDTLTGSASFLKSGAAASYVRRDGNLFRLRSRTVPMGAVEETDSERLRFDACDGDIVVMLSDGVSQTSEDAPWLMEILAKPLGQNLDNAAGAILAEAVKRNRLRDDTTVIVARVARVS